MPDPTRYRDIVLEESATKATVLTQVKALVVLACSFGFAVAADPAHCLLLGCMERRIVDAALLCEYAHRMVFVIRAETFAGLVRLVSALLCAERNVGMSRKRGVVGLSLAAL